MSTTSRNRSVHTSRGGLALLAFSLLAGSSQIALALPNPPLSDAPFEIPLDIIPETVTNGVTNPTNPYPDKTSTAFRLGINIGLGGAKPVEYLLDTGSTAFNVAVGKNYNDPAKAPPWFNPANAGPIEKGDPLLYGDGTYGNNGSTTTVPSLEFFDAGGKKIIIFAYPDGLPITLNTGGFATKESLGINKAGAIIGYFSKDYYVVTIDYLNSINYSVAAFLKLVPDAIPVYANQSQQEAIDQGLGAEDLPYSSRFYGIFGAGDFDAASVLGSLTKSGYVVAANGEVGPNHECTSTCAHVILNLTPAIRAQFTSILPWNSGTNGTFPVSGAPVSGSEFDVTLDYSLSDGKNSLDANLATLLDSGTPSFDIMDDKFLAAAKQAGFFDPDSTANDAGTGNSNGNIRSGLTFGAVDKARNTDPTNLTTANEYYGDASNAGMLQGGDGQGVYGLPFYFANSVMYDLVNQQDGYTSYFVSIAPIDTTSGYDVAPDMRPQGIAGVISGTGQFRVATGGAAQLSETNTYTGATVIDRAGLLVLVGPIVSIASSSGVHVDGMVDLSGVVGSSVQIQSLSGAGAVEMGAQLLELTSANDEFGGVLSDGGIHGGAGASLMLDAGVETLSGANTYTGLTTINGGTLVLKGGKAIADANEVAVNAGDNGFGTLQIDDAETIGSLSGTGGAVVLNAALETGGNNGSTVYSGSVSGSGALVKSASGTFTLSGPNTYSGATIINAGTMVAKNGAAIGDNSAVVVAPVGSAEGASFGAFEVDDAETIGSLAGSGGSVVLNAALTTGGDSTDTSYAGVISGTGALDKVGTGIFALTGANTYSGGTVIEGGVLVGDSTSIQGAIVDNAQLTFLQNSDGVYSSGIGGAGVLVKDGTAKLILSGPNTLTGITVVRDGVLALQGGSAIADTARVEVGTAEGGTGILEVDNAETIGSLSGASSVLLNANLTTGGDNTDSTYAGSISGAAGLVKQGSGTFQLTGPNSYSGGTTIGSGVLLGDTASIQGDIVDNAGLAFLQTSDGTHTGKISGTGALRKAGSGTVTLAGANSYSGGTLIEDGTLAGDSAALQGDVVDNATLSFVQASDGVFAGAVSGTGQLVKDGSGTLSLTGGNSYSGGTRIVAGRLAADTSSLQGDIADDATLAFVQAQDGTFTGAISGTGGVVKGGAGRLVLRAANTYGGGTTVNAGVLQGDTASIQGDIVNNAVVVFAQSTTGTYTGSMSGTGGVEVAAASGHPLSFASHNSYSGDTEIKQGLFNLDGVQERSRTVVDAGATLGGSGMGHGIFVKAGGTVAPGHSVGTLSSDGAGIQMEPGSVYHVEIKQGGLSDQLVTTGKASIDRATLLVTMEFSQAPVTLADLERQGSAVHYQILKAHDGVDGKFIASLPHFAFFDSSVIDSATDVSLSIGRNTISFADIGATTNQRSVGAGIAGLGGSNFIYDAFLASPTAQDARTIENQLSGEIHGDVAGLVLDDSAMLRDAVLGRINTRTPDTGAFWLKVLDSAGIAGSDGNAAKVNHQTNGVSVGADALLGDDWLIGAAGAYESSPLRTAGMGSASVDSYHVGVYTGGDVYGLSLRFAGSFDHYKAKTVRAITVPAFAAVERSQYDIDDGSASGEVGYGFVDGDSTFEPFADMSWTQANLGEFVESAGLAALEAKAQSVDRTQSILGARYAVAFRDGETLFTPTLTFGWVHNFDKLTPSRRVGFVDGTDANGFTVDGVTTNQDAGLIHTGLDANVGSGFNLGLGYEGQFGARGQDQAVRLNVRVNY